ncbi:MAG TPA: LysR family transcriptional regulator [Polyangiaceae bacterium]|nr:LysR family transcriptional regulator [Polyangiaceae bacterium]
MRDDLPGLRALLSVAQKKSFTAAAAALRVSPSAVSQTVRVLEDRVGVRLLARTTRNVALTEAGAQFVARLEPALGQIDEALESLGELRGRPSGLLRLTLLRTGYADVFRPILTRFLAAYPDIRVDISIDEALTNVVAEGFDAGLRLGHTLDREMIAVRVSVDQRVVVVGSPAYFTSKGKPTHPRDLHAHDCINLRKITRGTVDRWRFVEDGKDVEIAVDGRVVTNDGALLVDAALDGLGLAYVFESMVRHHVAEKRLVRVLDKYCPEIPGYFLYYPSRVNIAPKLKALVDFIRRGRVGRGAASGTGAARAQGRA